MLDALVDLPQQRLHDHNPSVKFGFQFPLQIKHGGLPALCLHRRVTQRHGRLLLLADLLKCLVGYLCVLIDTLAHFDLTPCQHPSEHHKASHHQQLSLLHISDQLANQIQLANRGIIRDHCVRDDPRHWNSARLDGSCTASDRRFIGYHRRVCPVS